MRTQIWPLSGLQPKQSPQGCSRPPVLSGGRQPVMLLEQWSSSNRWACHSLSQPLGSGTQQDWRGGSHRVVQEAQSPPPQQQWQRTCQVQGHLQEGTLRLQAPDSIGGAAGQGRLEQAPQVCPARKYGGDLCLGTVCLCLGLSVSICIPLNVRQRQRQERCGIQVIKVS